MVIKLARILRLHRGQCFESYHECHVQFLSMGRGWMVFDASCRPHGRLSMRSYGELLCVSLCKLDVDELTMTMGNHQLKNRNQMKKNELLTRRNTFEEVPSTSFGHRDVKDVVRISNPLRRMVRTQSPSTIVWRHRCCFFVVENLTRREQKSPHGSCDLPQNHWWTLCRMFSQFL